MKPISGSSLEAAYLQTDYSFTTEHETLVIRLGEENAALIEFLEKEQIGNWAYITAWNPHSVLMPQSFNRLQQQGLLDKLKGFRVFKGEGRGRDGRWPAEESLFIAGISREEACVLGRSFNQNAILLGDDKGAPVLEILFPDR